MSRYSILLIDDDEVFLEALSTVLSSEFEVRHAATGEEAVTAVSERAPDLIVLDVMMSYASEGYDLARMLKSQDATSSIPIILLTSVDKMFETRSRIDGSWAQCDGFMTKPPDFEKLVQSINSLINKQEQSQARD